MQKVLVSACLLGNKVRYNASSLSIAQVDMNWLEAHVKLVKFCPEVSASLPTPRPPAEIIHAQGIDVIRGRAQVLNNDGSDVTQLFIRGAENALTICQEQAISYALLAEASPSCGSAQIYDGSFTGRKIDGDGVTAALLVSKGIKVFSQHTIAQLKAALDSERRSF